MAESFGANGVNALPAADVTGTIAMSATAGKVALVNNGTALSGACPVSDPFCDMSVGFCVECVADENCRDVSKPFCRGAQCTQ